MKPEIGGPAKAEISTDSVVNELLSGSSEVYPNVSQKVIIITEDKICLCLLEHLKRMGNKRGWIGPFSVFITLVVTLLTSTFNNIGFDAATWKALFIIADIISFGWLVWSIKQALRSEDIQDVIDDFRGNGKLVRLG